MAPYRAAQPPLPTAPHNPRTTPAAAGTSAWAVSAVVQRLWPTLRRRANLGVWQVISPGATPGAPVAARVVYSKLLADVQVTELPDARAHAHILWLG